MKLRTEIQLPPIEEPIDHRSVILMLGSCFTGLIGDRLRSLLFDVTTNPFGVLYNPVSIVNGIDALIRKGAYGKEDLLSHNGLWFSFDHYTKYSDPDAGVALRRINHDFDQAKRKLQNSDLLILTPGTSFVYKHRQTGRIVSNCHKIPASEFNRYMLDVDRVVELFSGLVERINTLRPDARILFTVSPVRHLKDGFAENQHSKSVLLLATRELVRNFPDTCHYFPSYEIMMDDLRDYRFYDSDLLHPGETAVNYIWEKFRDSMISGESRAIIGKLEKILKATSHKPLHSNTESYHNFVENTRQTIRKLKIQFPFLQWENMSDL